jgi:hypothetical protein
MIKMTDHYYDIFNHVSMLGIITILMQMIIFISIHV